MYLSTTKLWITQGGVVMSKTIIEIMKYLAMMNPEQHKCVLHFIKGYELGLERKSDKRNA